MQNHCPWDRLQDIANVTQFSFGPKLDKIEDEREKPIVLP